MFSSMGWKPLASAVALNASMAASLACSTLRRRAPANAGETEFKTFLAPSSMSIRGLRAIIASSVSLLFRAAVSSGDSSPTEDAATAAISHFVFHSSMETP